VVVMAVGIATSCSISAYDH